MERGADREISQSIRCGASRLRPAVIRDGGRHDHRIGRALQIGGRRTRSKRVLALARKNGVVLAGHPFEQLGGGAAAAKSEACGDQQRDYLASPHPRAYWVVFLSSSGSSSSLIIWERWRIEGGVPGSATISF